MATGWLCVRRDSFALHVVSNFLLFGASPKKLKAVVCPICLVRLVLVYEIANTLVLRVRLLSHVTEIVGALNNRATERERFIRVVRTQEFETCVRQRKRL